MSTSIRTFFLCEHTQKQMLVHTASLSHFDLLDPVGLETESLGSLSPVDQHTGRPPLDWESQPVVKRFILNQ